MKLAASILILCVMIEFAQADPRAPFPYLHATAYHVMPETHSEESGYFSLNEGRDGRIYIGTAKYNANAYLVEFDPITERQRIVVDTQDLCGLNAIGFAAQAKVHTRNFVGPSGGIMHVGFNRPWKDKKERAPSELAWDMVVLSWDDTPKGDTKQIQEYKDKGVFVLGFGPKSHPGLSEHVKRCDFWLDTGNGANDRLIDSGGNKIGKSNHILNALLGWTFTAEFISALTRSGKMPVCWKSWFYKDGKDWSERYFRKEQFHDDFNVAPIPEGELAKTYLDRMRSHFLAFERHQLAATRRAVQVIVKEHQAGKTTVVASSGHMAMNYIGQYDDKIWAKNIEVHDSVPHQMKRYREQAPNGGLTLRLGYMGLHKDVQNLFKEKKSRVLLITAEHPYAEFQFTDNYPEYIDMEFAFGDACVSIEGYPIRLFPASGVMQAVAYECVNVEVLSRL